MKTTYVWREGQFVDKRTGLPMATNNTGIPSVHVMSDIASFKSPLDFKTEITSRSQLRDYEKRHGVKQVGNDFASTHKKIAEQG